MTPLELVLSLALLAVLGACFVLWRRAPNASPVSTEDGNDEQAVQNLKRELRLVRSDFANEQQKTASLEQQLKDAGRNKSAIIDRMGYFLRTPLNLIIGYSELLESGVYGELNTVQRTRSNAIHRAGGDLLGYFSNMLDMDRMETGRLQLQLKAVPVQPLIEHVIAKIDAEREDKHVTLQYSCEPSPAILFGDESRIEQVLRELILNALRFTPKGNVSVCANTVRVRNGKADDFALPTLGWLSDGEWVIVTVKDTGIGISSEAQAHIFDAFFQIERPATESQVGIGLGLSIVKGLVQLHQGVIWLKSAPDQGSTFFVALRPFRDIRATDTEELQVIQRDEKP
jgi:signal transduction histidine kinase